MGWLTDGIDTRRAGLLSFLLSWFLQNVIATEVTASVWLYDNSLGVEIDLPVLTCRSKSMNYSEVLWYKDYTFLGRGPNVPAHHALSLVDLLAGNASSSTHRQFDHALQLQGYYWCETDRMNGTAAHSYLFRIPDVHTFVGKFASTKDSLGVDGELSLKDKISLKKAIYEDEMQEALFGFLPKPNAYVINIGVLEKGLEVRFYVYARRLLHPRQPYASELVQEQHELESMYEQLRNETGDLPWQTTEWARLLGVDLGRIELRGTLGCYHDVTLVPAEPPKEVTWPSAEIGEVVIPEEACSSESGLAVTRLCTGSFNTGARWGSPSSNCRTPPNQLTAQLMNLYSRFGDDPKPVYVEKLQKLTNNSKMLTVTDLHIVTNILEELSQVSNLPTSGVEGIFPVVDRMAGTNRSELEVAKRTIQLTSRLLRIIGSALEKEGEKLVVSGEHLLVDTTKEDSGNGTTKYLRSGAEGSIAYLQLPRVVERVSVVLFDDWRLFPSPVGVLERRNSRVLPSPVLHVAGGPAWNLTDPVRLYFKDVNEKGSERPVCVQFDPRMEGGEGAWNSEGCEYAGRMDGFHVCHCHHLSTFAVVLSERPDAGDRNRFRLGTSVYVGCAASIIALSFTVVLYLLSKIWRRTVDHGLLFWLSLALLCFVVLLLASEGRRLTAWRPSCRLVAMLLHYAVLVVAGWLLVQALVHRLRFANKTDLAEVPHFLLKSTLCCWGVPILIMIIIWLTKDYKSYKEDSCERALLEVSRWTLIPVSATFLVSLCLNVCAVYAITCRFRQDYLIGNAGYDEAVIKFRIAFTIYFFFVMTYVFGFFALHNRSRELRILFSISITLTAYYVTLFFVFQEVSLWEMCRKWKKRRSDKSGSEAVKFIAAKEPPKD